jgi:hypothetical protein
MGEADDSLGGFSISSGASVGYEKMSRIFISRK